MRTYLLLLLVSVGLLMPAMGQNTDDSPKGKDSGQPSIDEQISFHVRNLSKKEFDKRMSFMKIVIDDISRLCDLKQEQKQKLNLAAKGASNRSMERWHEQAVRYFKTRVSGADAETARDILANIGTVNFGNRNADREGEMESLWIDSLETILTAEQIATYEAVREQREQAKIDSFSRMAIALLDNYLRLTPEQKAELTPVVNNSAKQYLGEIQRYWGDFLEKNMLMSLVNAADKSTLTTILSSNQYTRLRSATSNLDHFWDQRRREKEREKVNQKDADAPEQKLPAVEAIQLGGKINAGRIRIKGGANGAVVIKPGAVISGNVTIEAGEIKIESE